MPETLFHLFEGLVFLGVGGSREGELAIAPGEWVVVGRCPGDQLLLALQASRQAGTVATIEQGFDQPQRMHLAWVLGSGQAWHIEAEDHTRQLRTHMQRQLAQAGFRQFQRQFRGRRGALGDRAEVALGQCFDFIRGHIADHHQGRIVRHVPGLIPLAQVFDLHTLQISHPADGRGMVATGRIGHGLEQLEGLGIGIVVGAQAPLFLDDFDFPCEFVGRQAQAGHAIGLEFQGNTQAVAGQYLVISGVVIAGKGVFFGAQVTQDARGFARADFLAALEHHVFQGMGQTGLPWGLVTGADLVPDLGNHHRGTVILAHDDLQAIVEDELVGRLGIGGKSGKRQTNCAEQQAGSAAG
ncbi:hypothetical protein D9M71_203660 [compost metagenome]